MFIESFSTQAFSEKICWIFNTTSVSQFQQTLSSALVTNAILFQCVVNVVARPWISQVAMRSLNRSPAKSQLLLAHRSHEVQKEDGEPVFQTQHFLDTLIANHRALPHMNSSSKLVCCRLRDLTKDLSKKTAPPLTPLRLLKRYGACEASLKEWRWTDLS